MWRYNYSDELYHHGIKGQKWGVRRYQNKDGSLTAAGRSRYDEAKKNYKDAKKEYNKSFNRAYRYTDRHPVANMTRKGEKGERIDKYWEDAWNKAQNLKSAKSTYKKEKKNRKQDLRNQMTQLRERKDLRSYDNATRRRAAKYIVDKNMSADQAVKKAKQDSYKSLVSYYLGYFAADAVKKYSNK